MMKRETFEVSKIYVPVKRRLTIKPEVVAEIAKSMMANGQQTPIMVREDGERLVLVEGLQQTLQLAAIGVLALQVQAPGCASSTSTLFRESEIASCWRRDRPWPRAASAGWVARCSCEVQWAFSPIATYAGSTFTTRRSCIQKTAPAKAKRIPTLLNLYSLDRMVLIQPPIITQRKAQLHRQVSRRCKPWPRRAAAG